MEQFLKNHLMSLTEIDQSWTVWKYSEDVNPDALSDDWLKNETSYIHKVATLCAIDANKCDWVYIVIGVQRTEGSNMKVKGMFYFDEGENDDIGRVIERAMRMLKMAHPVFGD